MFNKDLGAFLSPLGFRVIINQLDEDVDFNVYHVTIKGRTYSGDPLSTDIEFAIPKPYDSTKRVFRIEGSTGTRNRIVCNKVFYDILDTNNIVPRKLAVKRWIYLVIDAVNQALHEACFDWSFGGEPPNTDLVTSKINEWFNTSPFVMDVDPFNKIEMSSISDIVVFDINEIGIGHNNRVFLKDWIGSLDPCSTPSSDRINSVYRLADGAKIEKGYIVPSSNIFCRTITENAIASSLNPRRNYLLRTTFQNSCKLVTPETPLVSNKNNQLSGINLLTAIMHLREHTFEDCIAISESASKKFVCYVEKYEIARSQYPIEVMIKEGDVIKPYTVIAKDELGREFKFSKLKVPASCINIEVSKRTNFSRLFNCVRFTFCSIYPLINGDKLSNRGAVKGVVKVIKDENMPVTADGKIIDICISPESIYKRRCMSLYWEMMAGKAGITIADHFTAEPSFETLAKDYGESEQLSLYGKPLPEKTFIGNVFWLRLNKHAEEALSAKGKNTVLNQYGLKVDDASISGQRRDPAKSIAMVSRGLSCILDELIKDTVGVNNLKQLLDIVI